MENVTADRQVEPAMDDSAEAITGRVRALRKRTGWTMAKLAKEMGFKGASSIQRYESPDTYPGGFLSRDLVKRFADVLIGRGDPPIRREEVWELAGPEFSINAAEPANATVRGRTRGHGALIPLYGQAVGGVDGQFVLNEGNKRADIIAPPALASVDGAYAVTVAGDSMEPRYFDGEVVFVHPKRRAVRGDFVVVQLHNPDESEPPLAYIKRLIRHTEAGLILEQYNPPKELRFEHRQVISVHVIVAAGDKLLDHW